jgi:hypothetical protein
VWRWPGQGWRVRAIVARARAARAATAHHAAALTVGKPRRSASHDEDREEVAPPRSLASGVAQRARGSNPGRTVVCIRRCEALRLLCQRSASTVDGIFDPNPRQQRRGAAENVARRCSRRPRVGFEALRHNYHARSHLHSRDSSQKAADDRRSPMVSSNGVVSAAFAAGVVCTWAEGSATPKRSR